MPPVLVTAFNRPDKLIELLSIVKQARPPVLYVFIDGPREGDARDRGLVEQTASVARDVDWVDALTVEVRTRNFGCGLSPAGAIEEVLKREEMLIILEDDCYPSPDFFEFMKQGLHKYRTDERVGAICGTSYVPSEFFRQTDSVWVSRLFSPWGWGTWPRAWRGFTSNSVGWTSRTSRRQRFAAGAYSVAGLRWLESNWQWLSENDPDGKQVWDHLFELLLCANDQVVLKPTVNLVTNVGYGEDATHAKSREKLSYVEALPWAGNLTSWPEELRVNRKADRWIMKHDYQAQSTSAWLGDLTKAAISRVAGRS